MSTSRMMGTRSAARRQKWRLLLVPNLAHARTLGLKGTVELPRRGRASRGYRPLVRIVATAGMEPRRAPIPTARLASRRRHTARTFHAGTRPRVGPSSVDNPPGAGTRSAARRRAADKRPPAVARRRQGTDTRNRDIHNMDTPSTDT